MTDSALEEKIIRQIEYYFGDVNLSRDKFLQEETQKDNGWVALDTLIKFNRLKQLTTDFGVILDSLKKSQAELLEIDEESKKIRRKKPLPDNLSEFETNLKQNTVYVKGFPTSLQLDELFAFFEKHGKILQIFMRRFPGTKQFKGSVFVTFETNDQMKSFLAQTDLKHENEALHIESQEEYLLRKAPQIEKIKEAKLKKEQQKEDRIKQKKEAEEAFLKDQQVAGAVLHLKGFNSETSRENIKELFDNFAQVAFVEFNKGQENGYVRFKEENKAKEALQKALEKQGDASEKLKLKGAELEARVLEGEEEQDYWKKLIAKLHEVRSKRDTNRNGRRNKKQTRNNRNRNYNDKKRKHDEDGADEDNDDGADDDDDDGAEDNADNENGQENGNKKQKSE